VLIEVDGFRRPENAVFVDSFDSHRPNDILTHRRPRSADVRRRRGRRGDPPSRRGSPTLLSASLRLSPHVLRQDECGCARLYRRVYGEHTRCVSSAQNLRR
jgi:hypothetical protein